MDLKSLSESDLVQLALDVQAEQERRQRIAAIPDQVADLRDTFVSAGGDLAALQAAITPTE